MSLGKKESIKKKQIQLIRLTHQTYGMSHEMGTIQ
jgi:hypothetical protein